MKERPDVGYASKKLSLAEAKYPIIEKECLAVVLGIRHLKLYLAGKRFILQTNHKPLKYLKDAAYQNERVFHGGTGILFPCKRHPRKGEHKGRFLELVWIYLLIDRLSFVNIYFFFL